RAGVNFELERRAIAVRRGFGLDDRIDGRSARREAVDDKPRGRFEVARVEDDGLESDRVGARALGAELRVARFEMRGPDPRRVCRRREPALRLEVRFASENLKLVDAIPPGVLIPSHASGRLVDEKRDGVGVVDSDASGADAEPALEGPERRLRG